MTILVATPSEVLRLDPATGEAAAGAGLTARPTDLSADPHVPGRAWCATNSGGVFRTDDFGARWTPVGLEGEKLMTIATSPARPDLVWVGGEPSAVWRSGDGGESWQKTSELDRLPSSPEWAFPPRPDTHHVRWIGCHPSDPGRLWVAVEAGALVRTADGGRTWTDRVPGGPYDTHELAVHAGAPLHLRIAAGDGFYETLDGGDHWSSPMDGLEIHYLRSVAVDPGDPATVLVSGATGPRTAYVAGKGDGRIYRRVGQGRWERVTRGWPDPPSTIAPLLRPGRQPGELWAADERGVHRSGDGGSSWDQVFTFPRPPDHLRGLAILTD